MIRLPKNNTPRWFIFTQDIALCLFALGAAYLVRFDFVNIDRTILEKEWEVLKPALPIYIFVRALSFILAKTYAGIIRHTGTQDAKRIFLTVTLGSLVFMAFVPLRFYFYDGFFFLPLPIIFVEYLVSVFLLITFRIAVKLIYVEQHKSRGATQNIVIYGAGKMGLITKHTLEKDSNTLYNVIGFIDDDSKKKGKLLERSPIMSIEALESWKDKKQVDSVIISVKKMSPINKRKIIDKCLELSIQVSSAPPIDRWMNGEFTANQIQRVRIEDLLGRKEIKLNEENINLQIKDKVILITGGAGSIGSEMARQILKYSPKHLVLLDQAESPIYELDMELRSKFKECNWEIVIADVSNYTRMKNVFESFEPQVVFHAAAYKHVPLMERNPAEAIKVNIQGTKTLADLANENGVAEFVMVSTDKAVNPTNVMGASKRIAEIYIQSLNKESKTKFITTRFGNVLGSNGSVIPLFKKQIEQGGPLTVTHEEVTRFFMTIPEACQLVLEAGSMGKGGEIFVFDMGESVKIIDLAKKMIQLSGLEINTDIEIKITGLRPGEKLYEELLNNEENTSPTHHDKILIGKVREYNLTEVQENVEKLINAYSSQNNDALVKQMKEIVPEFKSNNSVFTKLD